ncbi:Aste57867_7099 [Aphanomyces stellatus]|uniref:Aste57867_7099 protein n=2 Tax=Aphanomyces stellatus TaxID=120398 RepID=A0A485KG34_9STRA|nr:hypothetical protein As57867_007076 [Aphanomyces stellatus]VFT84035.1 Aste57867_7099 [Aphanomyces stellatus]
MPDAPPHRAYLSVNGTLGVAIASIATPRDPLSPGTTLAAKLQAFADQVSQSTVFRFTEPVDATTRATLSYTNTRGNVLVKQFAYVGNVGDDWMTKRPLASVNGVAPPGYAMWPLIESPLVYNQSYYVPIDPTKTAMMNEGQYSYLRYPACPFYWRASTIAPWTIVLNPHLTSQYSALPNGLQCIPPPS